MMRTAFHFALAALLVTTFAGTARAQSSATLDAQASGPAPASVLAGQTAVIGAFDLAASGDDVTVQTVSITGNGTGNELMCAGVLSVRLVEDADGSGSETAGDTTHDTGTYSEDNGSITFDADVAITSGTSATLLVIYEFTELATDGATFNVAITAIGAIDGSAYDVPVTGLPAVSADTTITNPNPPGLTVGSIAVGDGEVAPGTTNVVARVTIDATGALQSLQSIDVQAAGSGRDDLDITSVQLVRDVNGNGVVDGTDDVLGSGTFSTDNGTLTLDGGNATLYIGITTNLLVTVTFGSPVPQTPMFGLTITGMVANGSPVVSGLPVTGAVLTVVDNPGADTSVSTGGCAIGTGNAGTGLALLLALIALVAIRRR